MKNLKCLSTFEERNDFIKNLWITREFQDKLQLPEFKQLIHDFCKYPRFVGEYSDSKIEHAHFYSWFNILIIRQYANPYIQDLYYLHELKHITTLTYDSKVDFISWKNKMVENELHSSLLSEVQIYDLIPELRSKTFNFPIWSDEIKSEIRLNPDYLRSYRKQAMSSPRSPIEMTLARYDISNMEWSLIWKNKYRDVELMMSRFYRASNFNPTRAIKFLTLKFNKLANNPQGIIFPDQAEQFSQTYRRLKKETHT